MTRDAIQQLCWMSRTDALPTVFQSERSAECPYRLSAAIAGSTGFTWNRNLPPTRPLMTGDSSSDRHFRPVRTQQLRLLQHGLHGFFLQIQRGSLRLQD